MTNKTQRRLLARITDPQTLQTAWQRIRAKRAAGGFDGVNVREFEQDLDRNLDTLRQDLLDERYVPHPLREIAIPKGPGKDGTRMLHLVSVRDKVTQEAVRSVLEPILDRSFLDCSYGYRPGRGPQRAIRRVEHALKHEKLAWVATADIDDFFGSLNQSLLLDRLRPIVREEGVLRLVHLWLRMGAVDGRGLWRDVYTGVGQGGIISPLLANFYLHPFDEYVTGRGRRLIRYADDFVILTADRAEVEAALDEARRYLEQELALRLNDNPRPISTLEEGFSFLGILFHGARRLIDSGKREAIGARVRRIAAMPDTAAALHSFNEAVGGWRRYYIELVDREEIENVQRAIQSGLADLVAEGFRRKRWTTEAQAEAALEGIETLLPMSSQERRALIEAVVRDARARSKAERSRPRDQARPPRPQERRRQRPVRARPGDSVPAAVRRVKRVHQRRLAGISELIVNTPGSFIGKSGERVVVRQERRNVCEIPSMHLTAVTVATHGVSLSTDVVLHCAQHDIPILFLSPEGKLSALLSAPASTSAALGLLQLDAVHKGRPAIELARRFVEGKVRNQMNLMKYYHKYHKRAHPAFAEAFTDEIEVMGERLSEIKRVTCTGRHTEARDRLLGLEGQAAQSYWSLVHLLLSPRIDFPGRRHQGATDLVNSLLNYGYAILQSRVYQSILRVGLVPQVSFLHAFQRGEEPTLVFDVMEEFRTQVVDRTAFALVARREPLALDERGLLTADTRRRIIARIYERLATLIGFRGHELKLDEIIGHQTRLLARHLQGKAHYRPFVAKW